MIAESVPERFPTSTAPREIRAVLLPEEVGQFDSEWRRVMARAAETLDLGEVFEILARWRHIAELTRADPAAHRRMLQRADQLSAGRERGNVGVADLRDIVDRRLDR